MTEWIIDEPESHVVFTVIDPEGISVHLYEEQWKHIKQGHPEIRTVATVRSVVKNPDIILANEARDSRIYSVASSTLLYLNVIAWMLDQERACTIRTAFKAPLLKGDCIWRRPKK